MTTKPRATTSASAAPSVAEQLSHPQALLQEAPLRELIAARAVASITAVGGESGFVVEIRFGSSTEGAASALLASSRGHARVFASLSAVAALLQRLGQPRFEVDATNYKRGRLRPAQPERSEAMKSGRLPKAAAKTKPNTKPN